MISTNPTVDASRALASVRYFRSLRIADGNHEAAAAWVASQNFRNADALLELLQKSGVSAADDADLRQRNPALTDLALAVRPLTVLGRLPGVKRMPFMSSHIGMTAAARAYWKRPGLAVPASGVTFGAPTDLGRKYVGAMVIARDQFLRDAGPLAERALAEDLLGAVAAAHDEALLDVDNAGDDDTPGSITYGGFKTASTGSSLAQIDNDLGGLVEELATEDLTTARWVLHPRTAAFLARLRGTGGGLAHPGVGTLGGTLLGIPVLASAAMPVSDDSSSETSVALIVGSGITVADEGEIELRMSKQAAVELDTAPTGDAGTPTAQSANPVSLFQSNATALMALSAINWVPRRMTVAATLTAVGY